MRDALRSSYIGNNLPFKWLNWSNCFHSVGFINDLIDWLLGSIVTIQKGKPSPFLLVNIPDWTEFLCKMSVTHVSCNLASLSYFCPWVSVFLARGVNSPPHYYEIWASPLSCKLCISPDMESKNKVWQVSKLEESKNSYLQENQRLKDNILELQGQILLLENASSVDHSDEQRKVCFLCIESIECTSNVCSTFWRPGVISPDVDFSCINATSVSSSWRISP